MRGARLQVRTFKVAGSATGVDVTLEEVDGRPLSGPELELPLWFGEVAPGASFAKRLAVRNNTSLPFPFEWGTSLLPQVRDRFCTRMG